jgi:CubicO group peptidase (beta-lactamase class C family)
MTRVIRETQREICGYLEKTPPYFNLAGVAAGVSVAADSGLPSAGMEADFAFPAAGAGLGSVFHMASVSKLFTGLALMLLLEDGKLDLEKPLTAYLPWFRLADERYARMTPAQMLSHTSGMPDTHDYGWRAPSVNAGALAAYAASDAVRKLRLLHDPGAPEFHYSNIAYEVLGCLVEALSGKAFDAFVRERVLNPLGMADSTFLTFARTEAGRGLDPETAAPEQIQAALSLDALAAAGLARPYKPDTRKHLQPMDYYPYNRAHGPSSTLTSTTKDMRRFTQAMLRGELLGLAAHRRARAPVCGVPGRESQKIGLSWFIRVLGGHTLYGHEGSDDGFRSSFWICPELGAGVCVLSNTDGAKTRGICDHIFGLLLEG